jgi:DNA-binding NarL/FixJ family response regulator
MVEDFRIIAQCTDVDRLMQAITSFPGAIVLFASSLHPDIEQLRMMLESAGSIAIVSSVTATAMVECVRRVARGDTWMLQLAVAEVPEGDDMVGTRVRDRLTPKEMRIVALIVQGCKNREIATRLKTSEQVTKNYLHSIFDKTGVSDRLELALFTIHHRMLAQAAADTFAKLEAEEQKAVPMAAD